jgi:hypothetical protein
MKLLYCIQFLLFSIIFYAPSYGQFMVRGVITDAATGLPMAGSSVFCQNTTLGTISTNSGTFSLSLPNGGYDLIISYTGYETQSVRIDATNVAALTIALKQKDKSLQEVSVTGGAEVANGYEKYGKFFLDNFIGTTPNAAQCTLSNPEALQFYFYKKRNRLKVKAKEDLIIINQALGYKIKFQLDSFAHEYGAGISTYTGFPFFEELPGTAAQRADWKENREAAYAGSRLHFVRSWYDSTLAGEGFVIERVDPSSKTLKTIAIDNPYDSSLYQVTENRDVEISFHGKLRVTYKNELPDPGYLAKNHLPAYLKSQISILDINEGFVIQQNGYIYEQNDITNTGYWSWKQLADALPYDYNPEQ